MNGMCLNFTVEMGGDQSYHSSTPLGPGCVNCTVVLPFLDPYRVVKDKTNFRLQRSQGMVEDLGHRQRQAPAGLRNGRKITVQFT